jgi:two-component system, response regulator FlrC
MNNVIEMANQIAPTEATVLITGESGTGKEIMAKYIHKKSRRSSFPFVSVNCAAIPDNLLESELFGHEKGSFTGAVSRRIGKFEEANNGTLLLDEISEMHVHLQAKLLRALQEREIDRVGGSSPVGINIRVIATSNKNLIECVQNKTFREDLYFRLNVVNLKVESLRERPNDIKMLSELFVSKYSKYNHIREKRITDDAYKALLDYSWPGNIRELENTIHRALLLSKSDKIDSEHLHLDTGYSKDSKDSIWSSFYGKTIEHLEKDYIIYMLNKCLGNKTSAATMLGISIRTLRNKLSKYSAKNA